MSSAASVDRFVPLADWLSLHQGLLLVAGPCSVESFDQLQNTARQLAHTGLVSVLRAGVWKPRSRPGQFEGVGSEALPWLSRIRAGTGLPVAVEAARPDHAELCLEHGIDIIWLGARTTVNPFMVQEIANAIRGTGMPVMIKNPVSPDLRLWTGAIERILMAGSNKIIAIHRGFQTHQKTVYRNIPIWEIPLGLKAVMPDLPLICDPSHIAGDKRWIAEVAKQSMHLQMDGLMTETHYKPSEARTDPEQQITPGEFRDLVERLLKWKGSETGMSHSLESLRREIDECDQKLLELLASRLSLSREAGRIKRKQGADILQPGRQQDLFADRQQRARVLGLDPGFVERLLTLLHEESVAVQSLDRERRSKQ